MSVTWPANFARRAIARATRPVPQPRSSTARGLDVHGVQIVGKRLLEERMHAPHLQALGHDVEHVVVKFVGAAEGVELGHGGTPGDGGPLLRPAPLLPASLGCG